MFELKNHKAIIKDMHLIESNRTVLLSDGDNDILYTGTNKYGNRILGSIVLEDDDSQYLRYLHILLTDDLYYQFIYRKISLLQILRNVEHFFVVDFRYDGTEADHSLMSLEDIPPKYRPLENSYCPDFILEPSLTYSVSLKGNFADQHKAYAEDINAVNSAISKMLLNVSSFVSDLELDRKVFVEAPTAGSFKVNFRIELTEHSQTSLFSTSATKIGQFIQGYLQYLLNTLPDEKFGLFEKSKVTSEEFYLLESQLMRLYQEKNIVLPADKISEKLVDSIIFSVKTLKDIDYSSSFNKIEFINISKTGDSIPIGLLNSVFLSSIDKVFAFDLMSKTDEEKTDEAPKEYRILVYAFNTQTGNGSAYLMVSEDKFVKVSLHVRGRPDYQHSEFTKSLDEGTVVSVTGVATSINGRPKALLVQY
jgi:hypothetical protein